MFDLKLTKYDLVNGAIFFIINIIFLLTDISLFNKINKYIAFGLIVILSIVYIIFNHILYQLLN
jgi:hypothetical protein